MKFVTKQQIQAYFDRVAASVDELSPHMRQARHPGGETDSYDYAGLLALGVPGLFEPLAEHQPRAHAALMALAPELLACELTSTDPVGRQTWTNDAFVGAGDRYVRVGAHFRGDSIAASGERSPHWFRYASLPPTVAAAYYRHATGFEVLHELPGNPYECRVLPAKIDGWLRADQVGGGGKKQAEAIKAGLAAVADPAATPRKDGVVWKSFACVLDSREQGSADAAGDLLFVQERSPSQRLFHVHDGDFATIRVVDAPDRLYDEYVAWVFAGGDGRFDFGAHSRPA
jgi:hypothetical protein